jgi:hypothetical protein
MVTLLFRGKRVFTLNRAVAEAKKKVILFGKQVKA